VRPLRKASIAALRDCAVTPALASALPASLSFSMARASRRRSTVTKLSPALSAAFSAAAKTRAFVSGTGKKPWKQKGTGRAQVGSSRTPLWRHGGTTHPPRPRSYDFKLSKKVERGALRSALSEKMKAGELVVVDALGASEVKTKAAVEMLKRLGVTGKAVLVDVAADEKLSRSVRNIPGVSLVASARLTARDVIGAGRVVATKGALEKLQEALA